MSEPQQEPNPSGSDPTGGPTAPAPGPSAGANRFWEQYGEAKRAGARNGGNGAGAARGDRPGDGSERPAGEHECLEWCPICRGAEVVRASAPPELRDQFEAIQRDALAMVKALIDAYLAKQAERSDAAAWRSERNVEDIPID